MEELQLGLDGSLLAIILFAANCLIVYLSYHLEYGVMIPLQVEHEQLALRFVQDC